MKTIERTPKLIIIELEKVLYNHQFSFGIPFFPPETSFIPTYLLINTIKSIQCYYFTKNLKMSKMESKSLVQYNYFN